MSRRVSDWSGFRTPNLELRPLLDASRSPLNARLFFRLSAFSPFRLLLCCERRATFATELGLQCIGKLTLRTSILQPRATLGAELHPLGIGKATARALHVASLLLQVPPSKEHLLVARQHARQRSAPSS